MLTRECVDFDKEVDAAARHVKRDEKRALALGIRKRRIDKNGMKKAKTAKKSMTPKPSAFLFSRHAD